MDIYHLTQRELAERWRISEATLERWRSEWLGSNYLGSSPNQVGNSCWLMASG